MVSIIIPVYNAEKYIEKCIDSILSQTYQKFEIIIINDGSNDKTIEKLEKYKKNKKIIIVNQKNSGIAKTRNKGIKLATGEFIVFIDNDDYIDNDYIENYVSNMENYDIVIGGYRRPNEYGEINYSFKPSKTEWGKYMIITPWARMYRKKFLIDHNITFLDNKIGEDIFLNVVAYSLTKRIKIIPYIGYNWYYNKTSISNTIHKEMQNDVNFKFLLDNIYDTIALKSNISDQYLKTFFVKLCIWYMLYSSKKCKKDKLLEEYQIVFDWLSNHYSDYKNLNFKIIKGESLKNKFIIFVYLIMNKLKIDKQFLKIYSNL